ncbi:MAG TPA: hypothetical protein VMS89_00930 [Methanoregulaceae archaeon]|nr:hypothetical protein [Methanoregulaceae archaeon]
MSDATFSCDRIEYQYGDMMKGSLCASYRKAGVVKRCGNGIILELPDGCYYLTPEDTLLLHGNTSASIVDCSGEIWGCAWLSPIRDGKKKDIVATIKDRIYVVSLTETMKLLAGRVHTVPLTEYHLKTAAM